MAEKFYLNPDIDMTKIVSSMQLDSDQVIATLEKDGYEASLEVRGSVRVFYGEDNILYRYPSEFPQELKELIATNNEWELDSDVFADETNWFEIFVTNPNYTSVPDAIVVDVEGYTPTQIKDLLEEYIDYAKESDEKR